MSSGYESVEEVFLRTSMPGCPEKSKKGKMLWDDAPDERKQEEGRGEAHT